MTSRREYELEALLFDYMETFGVTDRARGFLSRSKLEPRASSARAFRLSGFGAEEDARDEGWRLVDPADHAGKPPWDGSDFPR